MHRVIQPPGRRLDVIHDPRLETDLVRLMPGDYFISADAHVASTVLGSCISCCIRDVRHGVGGMNHFMLPDSAMALPDCASAARYGSYAMEYLIEGVIRLGGQTENFEYKVFGGGCIVSGVADVGKQNIEFIGNYLARMGVSPTAEDLGLSFPRKINYFTASGRVMVKKLRALHKRSVAAEERRYSDSPAAFSPDAAGAASA